MTPPILYSTLECPKFVFKKLEQITINSKPYTFYELPDIDCKAEFNNVWVMIINKFGFTIPKIVKFDKYYGLIIGSIFTEISNRVSSSENGERLTFIELKTKTKPYEILKYDLYISKNKSFIVNTINDMEEDGFEVQKYLVALEGTETLIENIIRFELTTVYNDSENEEYIHIHIQYNPEVVERFLDDTNELRLTFHNFPYDFEMIFDENLNIKTIKSPILDRYWASIYTASVTKGDQTFDCDIKKASDEINLTY